MSLAGPRVLLRPWTEDDLEPLAKMSADPEVMRYFPGLLSRDESTALLQRLKRGIDERGWGLWAVEINRECAGFTGLAVPDFEAAFMPCVEIGWRLRREFWGAGYALEAARLALRFAFATLRLPEVVSFTARVNHRSERLMRRLEMTRSPHDDFEHPKLPPGHRLRDHIVYRISHSERRLEELNQALDVSKHR
jgi:RimJ/RimL family protein N-acetyltransferase